jgi:excisionase family DNA binding protein
MSLKIVKDATVETAVIHDRILTIEQAAEISGMKVNTMYTLALRRSLPSIKIGKMRRIRESDLQAWLNSNRVEARPQRN